MKVDISIIIISFNTEKLLRRCLNECKKAANGLNYEIIVVDNASKDESVKILKEEFKEVILIESKINLGFGIANNLGYKQAKGDYIVLLNSDAFILEDGLKKTISKMKEDKKIGLAGAKLIGEDRKLQPSARKFPSVLRDFLVLIGAGKFIKRKNFFSDLDLNKKAIECDWVPGAYSVIRREALDKDQIFDERFFLYYEEVDMCLRLKKNAWKIVCYPDVEVIHLGGASTSMFSDKLVSKSGMQMTLWRLQSQYLYYRKNGGYLSAYFSKNLEKFWNQLRVFKNRRTPSKQEESRTVVELINKAWENTNSGEKSPEIPWEL